MRKWILWIIVVSIMISIMTGCIGGSGGSGGSGYAIEVLDTSFNGTGFVVHDNAAGGNSHDYGHSIYVDSNGKIYVTGDSWNSSSKNDMVIWRYNSNGSLDTSFNGRGYVVHHNAAGGNSDDAGSSIYVDSNGKIYVTGWSENSSGDYDMVIWKYK
jgi:uncharacterized delta-60 repeat protein